MNSFSTPTGLTVIGEPIPEGTTFNWGGAKPVRHFLLTVRTFPKSLPAQVPALGLEPGRFEFKVVDQTAPGTAYTKIDSLDDMSKHAGKIAGSMGFIERTAPVTPYDITINEPSWLLLELDKEINWRFSSDFLACTTKEKEPNYPNQGDGPRSGFNTYLRYAYSDGTVVKDPSEAKSGTYCRFIFFGVAHRGKYERQGFNLFVEFYQIETGGVVKTLPITLDPDVGNEGHDEFPSPP